MRSTSAEGIVHVTLSGELDIATVPDVDRALRRAWATSAVIVLDLRKLEFLDSSGAHLIMEAHRRIRCAGGRLITVGGTSDIGWLLTLLGVDRVVELVDQPPAGKNQVTSSLTAPVATAAAVHGLFPHGASASPPA
jgi:anti-sigma B factor antagonist